MYFVICIQIHYSSGELPICQRNEASQVSFLDLCTVLCLFTPNKYNSKGGVGTNSNSHSKECVDPKEISKSLKIISVGC